MDAVQCFCAARKNFRLMDKGETHGRKPNPVPFGLMQVRETERFAFIHKAKQRLGHLKPWIPGRPLFPL